MDRLITDEINYRRERLYGAGNALIVYISTIASVGLILTSNIISDVGDKTFWLLCFAGILFLFSILSSLALKAYHCIWFDYYYIDLAVAYLKKEKDPLCKTKEKKKWIKFVKVNYIFILISTVLLIFGISTVFLGMIGIFGLLCNIFICAVILIIVAIISAGCWRYVYQKHIRYLEDNLPDYRPK